MRNVGKKYAGALLGATLALAALAALAAHAADKPAAGEATGGKSNARWYYLGTDGEAETYIDRQQRPQRSGDTVTVWIRTTLDRIPDDLKVHPHTRYMDVQSRYDCRQHTVAHLKSNEISADNVYLGGEMTPLAPVPVNPGTRNAAVMSAVCESQ